MVVCARGAMVFTVKSNVYGSEQQYLNEFGVQTIMRLIEQVSNL